VPEETPDVSPRASLARRTAVWILLWTALGLFFASEAAIRLYPGRERSLPWSDALLVNIPFYLLWGIFALAVLRLARIFPIVGDHRARVRAILIHLAASLAVAALHLVAVEAIFEIVRWSRGRPLPFSDALLFSVRHNFHVNLLTYWAVVALRHLREYDRGLREKELVASRLKEQLASAELAALRMQLQPHFLFNALHSISSLVYEDPEAADRMLVRLSELLRQSLETRGQEIRLEQELDFVARYLDIEKMRYADRLEVATYLDPFALDGAVPAFVLQPLVENAVVHGVGRSRARCRVAVRTRRDDGELVLEVENDLPPEGTPGRPGTGVGMQNTRARLAQLYGERARLELEVAPGKGALARIVLPWRELDAAPPVQ
jgi:hypothetical protein